MKQYLNCYLSLSIKKVIKQKTNLANLRLIVICYPAILNPGPIISGLYQNIGGFIFFQELNKSILPLSITKLHKFQSYLFDKKPGLVILNETWLSKEHLDKEIFPKNSYKVFRLDRSSKTHPYDPLNPYKFRKRGGGVLIAIKSDINIESKMVGIRVKAEIISVEMKCGNDIFCVTTCYRVGKLHNENFAEVKKHLSSIARIKKYKKHLFLGDLNLNNVAWPDGSSTVELEQKFIRLFNKLGMQQMIKVPTHEQGKILDLLYVSFSSFVRNIKVLAKDDICSSDHFGVIFEVKSNVRLNNLKI